MSGSDKRTETLIESVSERVREMAESTLQDCRTMLRQAEEESRATRDRAERDAERARRSLRDVGEVVTELAEVFGGLRVQLDRLGARIAVARAALETDGAPAPVDPAPPIDSPPDETPAPAEAPAPAETPPSALTPEPAETPRSSDVGAARLLALNMALNGMEREELDGHIAELFDIEDRAALLDDVYQRRPLRGHG